MNRRIFAPLVLALLAFPCFAEEPVLVFPKLPVPLVLPPGLTETLPLEPRRSFFGEAIRVVDCPDDLNVTYGTCGNQMFGGLALGTSHLSGSLTIRFYPPVHDVSHFEVSHGVLRGEAATLAAPQGFEMPLLGAELRDPADGVLASGDVDLTTGGVTNIHYRVAVSDSVLGAIASVNPKLPLAPVEFPGVRGHAWIRFEQRADGLLDFTMQGTTFLPLGKDIGGDPVRFPLPFCTPSLHCAGILARGSVVHPELMLSTKPSADLLCAPNCPAIPENGVRIFTVGTAVSSFGDDFEIENPKLGKPGAGRSHLQGRIEVQFGPRTSQETIPFVITSLVPEGLLANAPESPILGHGPVPGLLGQEEILRFPLQTYRLERVVFVDEPYNLPRGVLDLRTGRVIGEMVYPSFYGQSLADVLFEQNDGRIEKKPFDVIAKGPDDPARLFCLFEKGGSGQTLFRFSGEHVRSFETYLFPSPDFVKANAFLAGPGSKLDLFLRLQASANDVEPVGVRSGGATGVVSSVGDRFSYSYSIPCDGRSSTPAFDYTNENAGSFGGTFHGVRLASATCTNMRGSASSPGDSDTIQFSIFGSWSKDPAGALPRLATVHVSKSAANPYVGILVYRSPDPDNGDNVIQSSANTKPVEKPLP